MIHSKQHAESADELTVDDAHARACCVLRAARRVHAA
jgi:hypothetical protein